MANARLGSNPLLKSTTETVEEFDAEKEREELGITLPPAGAKKLGRPINEELVRDNAAQSGLPKDWTRATFIVRVEHLEKLKDYAYTERISLKEALDQALETFLEDLDESSLLRHR